MNILPKKRWHVRTKDNIARVRRDEVNAAGEEKETQRRILLAEQEARTALLRSKIQHNSKNSKSSDIEKISPSTSSQSTHINFFEELEGGKKTGGTNKDYEQEKKEEQEKYEKNIGYLTYLGQSSLESQALKPWYETINREKSNTNDKEYGIKTKLFLDPLKVIKKHVGEEGKRSVKKTKSRQLNKPTLESYHSRVITRILGLRKRKSGEEPGKKHKKKHKKRKDTSSSDSECSEQLKQVKLVKLREERLKREQKERIRTEQLLATQNGVNEAVVKDVPFIQQKYHSQFNPHLARQNWNS